MFDSSGVKYYKLDIQKANNLIDTNIETLNGSFVIPNNVNFGERNYITDNTNIINNIVNLQSEIKKFTISLYDDNNNLVDLNGIDYILFFSFKN